MKGTLARLGIAPQTTLRKAAERLATLHTPEARRYRRILGRVQHDMARLSLLVSQIKEIENARQEDWNRSQNGPHAMVRLLARIVGVGIGNADMLVNEVLSRRMRDRKAVARDAGLTGSPDESGTKRREQGSQSRQCPGPPPA